MATGVHTHSRNAYRWLEQFYIGDYENNSSQSNGIVSFYAKNAHLYF